MKKEYIIIIAILSLLIGFAIGNITNDAEVITIEKEEPITQETKPTSELTNTGLPRDNKSTPFENYTNAEVRTAIDFARTYLNNPEALEDDHPKYYKAWWDYRKRVCHNETINNLMWYYNYWIMSFPYGI